jgi:bifunctional oligoribonuclease and PAP phosphatase NrnA
MKTTAQKIKQTISKANNIAVMCHKNPDGDALGSVTAIAEMLELSQKKYTLFCANSSPSHFDFLPHINKLQTDPDIIQNTVFDTIIILDSGTLSYAGIDELINGLTYDHTIINIDHHNSNSFFGDINYVNDESSSTCEIVYTLLRQWQSPINKNIATSLLNGIMTDTGMLTNPATNDTTLNIASDLMRFGANIYKISQYNIRNKKSNLLNLWGVAMQRIVYNKNFNCASTYITKEDFEKHNLDDGGLDGLSNFLSSIDNVDFTTLLIEIPDGLIKGSFRSTKDNVNVGALAQKLGGGGHKKAAGFVIKGKLSYNDSEVRII